MIEDRKRKAQGKFIRGYDPRRKVAGNTGMKYKSIKKIMERLIRLTPKEFYNKIGIDIPDRYRKNEQMIEAIISNNILLALNEVNNGTLKAMEIIYDRIDGKPKQTIEISNEITEEELENMSDEDLEKLKNSD